MLIVLPPSESKTGRARGRPLALDSLHLPELSSTREQVLNALTELSTRDDAHEVLRISRHLAEDLARNRRLCTAPAQPVRDLYTGVLYDALGLSSLDGAARRRATCWILVQSALFGALRLSDKVPPYRLSMGVNLPGVGPLAAAWRTPLAAVMPSAAGDGLVVDCRSSTYAAAWSPAGPLAERWVRVMVPGATHQAKHTRGLVTRHLVRHGLAPRTPAQLRDALDGTFRTSLSAPARAGRPWELHVQAP